MTSKGKGGLLVGDDPDDVYSRVADRFESKEYYIFIMGFGSKTTKMLPIMEYKYYKPGTEANEDFELAIFPGQSVIATAKKSRMTGKELIDIISPAFMHPDQIKAMFEDDGGGQNKDMRDVMVMTYPDGRQSE